MCPHCPNVGVLPSTPGWGFSEWAGWSVAWAGTEKAFGIPGLDLNQSTQQNTGAVAVFP